ncbi:MAG: S8 family serine peptidase [Saprospiraceae bacterium]
MTKRNRTLVLSTIITLCFSLNAFSQKNYTIQLLSESFTPSPNLISIQNNKTALQPTASDDYYHIIIQFETLPSKTTLQSISNQGIILDNYLPNFAYFASIPTNIDFNFLKNIKARSLIHVKSKWKLSPLIENIPAHALNVNGKADLMVTYFKGTDLSTVATVLQENNAEILFINDRFNQFKIRVPIENINALANENTLLWIEPIDSKGKIDNKKSGDNHRSSALSANFMGSRNLQGDGIIIGVWDTNLKPHIDFGTRVTSHHQYYSGRSEDHANHVTGTIAGAGLLDPNAIGMSPKATIHGWNCCTNLTPLPLPLTMENAILNEEVVITSNSYGYGRDCSTPLRTYQNVDRGLDQLVNDYPFLMLVYSAGNSQQTEGCTSPYFSTSWNHKNSLLVAATNHLGLITTFSSFGPSFDGRLTPNISGVGQNVYSTEFDNLYGSKSGTSMSCPGVAGTVAQLYQRYKQLYNTNPRADLIKAFVCNTAEDKGNAGPDYEYGYGQINALKAVELMESGNWLIDSIQQGVSNSINITVPQNMAELRIMLSWTDPAASTASTTTLVNDLDLILTNGTDTIRPWILDANNPNSLATRGVDRLNNIVQISSKSVTAGTYQLIVNGHTVTNGSQTYALVYETTMPEIIVTYPFGGEKMTPGSVENIYWTANGSTGSFLAEYTIDNGTTWNNIGSFPSTYRQMGWTVPQHLTKEARIRITSTNLSDESDANFTIAAAPNFAFFSNSDSSNCSTDTQMRWLSVPGADLYEIFQIDSTGLNLISTTTDTFYNLTNLITGYEYWFTLRASQTSNNIVGERAVAKSVKLSPPYDFAVEEIYTPNTAACNLGMETISVRISHNGCRTLYSGEKIPYSVSIDGSIAFQDSVTILSTFENGEEQDFIFTPLADLTTSAKHYLIEASTAHSLDIDNTNNTASKNVLHQPTISNIPYVESFEASDGSWSKANDLVSSWEWGNPNGFQINTASNGSKVWATNLDGAYDNEENSHIFSPCFDFSNITTSPYVVFDINHAFATNTDRAQLKYSTDDGVTWKIMSGFLFGASNDWETIQREIPALIGKSNVKFQVLVTSDKNDDVDEGIAIDNFRISLTPIITNTMSLDILTKMNVYPNPSTGLFHINVQDMSNEPVTLSVFDALGRVVTSYQTTLSNDDATIQLDLSSFTKGIYLLQLQSRQGQITEKIMVK